MRNTPYRRAKNEERNWRRVTGNWLVITVLCFIIFELESLPDGFAAMLEDTEEIMVNLVFSAIFSLTSLFSSAWKGQIVPAISLQWPCNCL